MSYWKQTATKPQLFTVRPEIKRERDQRLHILPCNTSTVYRRETEPRERDSTRSNPAAQVCVCRGIYPTHSHYDHRLIRSEMFPDSSHHIKHINLRSHRSQRCHLECSGRRPGMHVCFCIWFPSPSPITHSRVPPHQVQNRSATSGSSNKNYISVTSVQGFRLQIKNKAY